MDNAVGIDLGTTNCCVAAMVDGKAEVLSDEKGNKTFPSYLTFEKGNEIIVGHLAKTQVISNPYQTVFGVKRLIGRPYASNEVAKARDYFPYEIKKASDGGVLVVTEGRELRPEEVSSYLLEAIKDIAQYKLDQEFTKAVITVPAYFNSQQREKTKIAAETAGMEVLRLINEPTSAALAYGFRKNLDKRLMVFDLGGGTFDVSILDVGGNVFEVLGSNGDSYLGGLDFDYLLVDYLLAAYKKQEGSELILDPIGLQRLKDAAEHAKCELSFKNDVRVLLPAITEKSNLDIEVTRDILEEQVKELIDRTFGMIEKTLKECDLAADEIDDVVLVGGQTRMPLIQQRIKDFFGKPALKGVHPDEAVALGAAIHCNQLLEDASTQVPVSKPAPTSSAGDDPIETFEPAAPTSEPAAPTQQPDSLLVDVTPLPLGVDAVGDTFTTLIEKNSTVPCSYSRIFTTTSDFQEEVRIIVRQGEDAKASMNAMLGEFILRGIRQARKMEPQIEVTFKIDSNGILNVTARDLDTKKEQSYIINEFEMSA